GAGAARGGRAAPRHPGAGRARPVRRGARPLGLPRRRRASPPPASPRAQPLGGGGAGPLGAPAAMTTVTAETALEPPRPVPAQSAPRGESAGAPLAAVTPVLLTVKDAARLLKAAEEDIYRWVEDGEIPYVQVNDQPRFNQAELLEWATARHREVSVDMFTE